MSRVKPTGRKDFILHYVKPYHTVVRVVKKDRHRSVVNQGMVAEDCQCESREMREIAPRNDIHQAILPPASTGANAVATLQVQRGRISRKIY